MRRLWPLVLPLVVGSLAACSGADFNAFGPLREADAYNALFPKSITLCAVSGIDKIAPNPPAIHGGPGGHSVLFLRGACRDRTAHYPVLRSCDPSDPADPPGVGISANDHFHNANWIATDGPDFFFHGTLQQGETLDWSHYLQTQQAAQAMGILDGVVFRPKFLSHLPPGQNLKSYRYELSVSTDYAIDFGRGRFCATTPVSAAQMNRVIDALNTINRPYREGRVPYSWNVLQNNCTHLCHNAIAAADMWPENPVNQPLLQAAFDFPVPKNDLINLIARQDDTDLTDLAALWRDPVSRRLILDDGKLPAEPGTLISSAPIWVDNAVYRTSQPLIFYQDPIFGTYRDRFAAAKTDQRYMNLSVNFAYFHERYRTAFTARHTLAWWRKNHPALAQDAGFAAFYEAFYKILAMETDILAREDITLHRIEGGKPHSIARN